MNDQILSLTKKLIAFPSESNNREACLEILELAQKELQGFSFTPFAKNGIPSLLYTNTPSPTKKCKIILNAHLDVVPAKKEHFVPKEKDGKLYGRGAYDMKAAAAVMILLFKELAQELPYTLGLQLTTDEETIGFYGTNYQLEEGITGEFAITGECGSNLRITNRLRGLHVIELTASGVEAHAGHLWHGENALLKLYEAINSLLQHYPTPDAPSWITTINLANITTKNTTHNVVPSEATALLDIRTIPEDVDTILPKIQSLLPEGIIMKIIKSMPGLNTKETNPYIQKLMQSYKEHDKQLVLTESYAGSDMIFFAMQGIDGIEFGPIGAGQHSDEEWVNIKSLEDYYQLLKSFLLSIT